MPIDYDRFGVLTFDCYGTLIDWETGLLAGLRRALPELQPVDENELLEEFAALAVRAEAGCYKSYRSVLAAGLRGIAAARALAIAEEAAARFAGSVGEWPAFPDSTEARRRPGSGATPRADATPDERYPSMRAFADAAVPVTVS